MAEQTIVCAAIKNRQTELIIAGVRHFDMIMHGIIEIMPKQPNDWLQGFLNNLGEFKTREEALMIVLNNTQKTRSFKLGTRELFSEDLY